MVDWKEVERLRSKGWDWDSIAEDPKVSFSAPEGSGDAGRALKALYHNRKSQRSRTSRGRSVDLEEGESPSRGRDLGQRLFIVGLFIAVAAAAWSVIAVLVPAPFGILVTFYPDLIIGLLIGAGLLGAALVIGLTDLKSAWVKPVAVGLVIGLVGVGLSGYVANQVGYLSLAYETQYGNGWGYASNPAWTDSGKPVVFFMGSEACPYCAALSWSLRMALEQFGSFNGGGYTYSNPNDVPTSIPEVIMAGSSLSSSYLSWDPAESTDNTSITIPSLGHIETSYLQAYDPPPSSSVPFLVFYGHYIHLGQVVDPSALDVNGVNGDPYSWQAINQQLQDKSGPSYTAILDASYLLEAYFEKIDRMANINPPSNVVNDPNVSSDYQSIP
jgi:hypothetical protein